MKRLTILLFALFIASVGFGQTNYYVKNGGNDGNTGLSDAQAWETVSKVNTVWVAGTFAPGDLILFKRGSTFYGTINVTESGAEGNEITVGAYGTGNNPIISGFTTLTSWSSSGGGIYKSLITSPTTINMVTLDGVPQSLGRWPNTGYRTFESHTSNVSITDNELTGTPNWTGAEVVIRKTPYSIYRNKITSHTTNTITYTSKFSGEPTNGYGYFIQNDIKTLDNLGEWYYDETYLYMYFGEKDPTSYSIKVSTIDQLVYIYGRNYITLEDISFEGANVVAITTSKYNHITIQNCNIDCSGKFAIKYIDAIYNSYYLTIDNCVINNSLDCAINLNGNCIKSIITNNTITNSGLLPGMGNSAGTFLGAMYCIGPKGRYEYNKIENVGRNGIWFHGDSSVIKNNFINNFCLVLEDAGGIYLSDWSVTYGKRIVGNIILNGIGNREGVPTTWPQAEGIYLDYDTKYVEISGNTVANCSDGGVKLHSASDTKIEDNTFFNNLYQSMFHQSTPVYPIENLSINRNIFFSKEGTQKSLFFKTNSDNLTNFGTADNNYYARPIDDDDVFYTYQPSTGTKLRTLAGWQSFTNQDANSKKSPKAVGEDHIEFYYNATQINDTITLTKPMLDMYGDVHPEGDFVLEPYTSAVLLSQGKVQMNGNKVLMNNGKVVVKF